MKQPQASIALKGTSNGWLALASPKEVTEELDAAEMIKRWAVIRCVHYEGHEFELRIRPQEVAAVASIDEERFRFELSQFAAGQESAENDSAMRRAFATALREGTE